MLYVDHIDRHGHKLFEKVCELDLEGIVAKRMDSQYRATEKPHRIGFGLSPASTRRSMPRKNALAAAK